MSDSPKKSAKLGKKFRKNLETRKHAKTDEHEKIWVHRYDFGKKPEKC